MKTAHLGGQATATSGPYRAAVAGPVAVVAHHELAALFHELAGLLHHVLRFDCPTLILPDAARSAPLGAPAPPGRRFARGASALFPTWSRFAPSATQYRSLACDETHRRQRRRHALCFWREPALAGAVAKITAPV